MVVIVKQLYFLWNKTVLESVRVCSNAEVRLPEGRSEKRLWLRWLGSFMLLKALFMHLLE